MANSEKHDIPGKTDAPRIYQIRIEGHLNSRWSEWFEGLDIFQEENGDTTLSGPVADQSELHGLLKKIRDLGMPLVSVIRLASPGEKSNHNSS